MAGKVAGANRHWAQIEEVSFVAGMRLLFWLARVLGRWPFRAVLYPVLLWYALAKPWARAASKDYLRRIAKLDGMTRHDRLHWTCYVISLRSVNVFLINCYYGAAYSTPVRLRFTATIRLPGKSPVNGAV